MPALTKTKANRVPNDVKSPATLPGTKAANPPTKTNKMNAYAIHGRDSQRVYEALYPVPYQKFSNPDL